ncbi:uncharacterized protein E0L32_003128 [Thyridium curvatum]|uniref:Ribosomal protein L9 domain-containing protein n=1 Tax=Thyridium curvatum TaxID=1093900 RepID=A0A507B2Z8_9PEZI|nr:uncharacterized protein E0L32_003128 [Thyridium curvatum]TPX17485.1 hypothetical protein E0L32_003128 [Thyridium curvatum]
MVAPLFGRAPTCLGCLRRSLATAGVESSWLASAVVRTQVRGKKSKQSPDQGVVVRLLEDIPKFGRKGELHPIPGRGDKTDRGLTIRANDHADAIFRIDRGRMRNLWYPSGKAEYMTATRFSELGLSRGEAIGERDPMFGSFAPPEVDESDDFELSSIQIRTMSPERTAELLESHLPQTLTFARKPINAQQPAAAAAAEPAAPPRSPLLAARAAVSTGAPAAAPEPTPEEAAEAAAAALAIFGSVSTHDVAATVRQILARADPEAGAVAVVEARDVKFVGLEDGVDRVKALGRWEVDILPGKGAAPVRKVVEIVAEE